AEKRLWASGAQRAGVVRCLQRLDRGSDGSRPVCPRAVESLAAASAAEGGGPAGGRPRLLLVCAPGVAVGAAGLVRVSHAPAADRELPSASQVPAAVPPRGSQGSSHQPV